MNISLQSGRKMFCDITREVIAAMVEDKQALSYTDDSSAGHLFESHHAPSQQREYLNNITLCVVEDSTIMT